MITHALIDRRLYRLIEACIGKADGDPALIERARRSAARIPDVRLRQEWIALLGLPWLELKARLLEKSERGAQLRQNAPFGGFLSNAERLRIFKES